MVLGALGVDLSAVRPRRDAPRPRLRHAVHAAQRGRHHELEAHVRAHGVARQPKHQQRGGADDGAAAGAAAAEAAASGAAAASAAVRGTVAKVSGFGLHPGLAKMDGAAPRQQRLDEVAIADRDAARGNEHVGAAHASASFASSAAAPSAAMPRSSGVAPAAATAASSAGRFESQTHPAGSGWPRP